MAELILALDLPARSDALRLLDRLPALRWVKVGSILMTAEGPALIRELVARGLQVFLDLKWHDIPSTVAGAVTVAGGLGVHLATVHAAGGPEMLRAAAAAAAAGSVSLVGVTVLTSDRKLQSPDFTDGPDGGLAARTEHLATVSVAAGLSGVVCSALEIEAIRRVIGPDRLIVVPGIRRPGDDPGDQQRTASPAEAVRRGATHLVVGRPIVQAPNPAASLAAFYAELEGVS
jgi:orotidine-5'-phosphate decarboxylase